MKSFSCFSLLLCLGYLFIYSSINAQLNYPQNQNLFGGFMQANAAVNVPLASQNKAGDIDMSFGYNGRVDLPGFGMVIKDEAIQSDNKIVLAGSKDYNGSTSLVIARYLPGGQPDVTFGSNGVYVSESGFMHSCCITILDNGKIFVCGIYIRTNPQFGWEEKVFTQFVLTQDGILDSTYGTNGKGSMSFPDNTFGAGGSVEQLYLSKSSSGSFFVAGSLSQSIVFAASFNSGGGLDYTYGINGIAIVNKDSKFSLSKIFADSKNRLLICGTTAVGTKFAVYRLDSTGNFDTSFNETGYLSTLAITETTCSVGGIQEMDNNKLALFGCVQKSNNWVICICYLNEDGTFNDDVYSGGLYLASIIGYNSLSIIYDSSSKKFIILAEKSSGIEWELASLNPDGTFDMSFGVYGSVTIKELYSDTYFYKPLTTNDGKILLTGKDSQANFLLKYFLYGTESSSSLKTRVFVSLYSPNCLHYMDVVYQDGAPSFGKFKVVPAYGASNGKGKQIEGIWPHEKSGYVFLKLFNGGNPKQLKKVNIYSTTPVDVSDSLLNVYIKGDYLFYLNLGKLHFGLLNASGNFTEGSGSPILMPEFSVLPDSTDYPTLHFNPKDNTMYIFKTGNSPMLFKFSSPFNSMSKTTTYSNVMPAGLDNSYRYDGFGIAPDGHYFITGKGVNGYSVNGSAWVSYPSNYGGGSIIIAGDSTNYYVYNGGSYNTNKGDASSWFSDWTNSSPVSAMGANLPICVDPNNYKTLYYRTETGLGVSIDRGITINGYNNGLEGAEVLSMDLIKEQGYGWVASSAGLRKVTNFKANPIWSDPVPFYGYSQYIRTVLIDRKNLNTIYAAHDIVFKSIDGGLSWNEILNPFIEQYDFRKDVVGGMGFCSLAICEKDNNIVAIGYRNMIRSGRGLFLSMDAGQTWKEILLKTPESGMQYYSISKLMFNYENGDTVLYACNYESGYNNGFTMFRLVKRNKDWTPSFDMSADKTITGNAFIASMKDICKNSDGSKLYAIGYDESPEFLGAAVYCKDVATGMWSRLTKSGLPTIGEPRAITLGNNKIYIAIDYSVYYMGLNDTKWTLGYAYNKNNDIYFLSYDDLLVGTATGLFEHFENSATAIQNNNPLETPSSYKLFQNYPNPFNPTTIISFTLPKSERVLLKVYDMLGREVTTLVNEEKAPGSYKVRFNGNNLSSGIYIYRLVIGNYADTKKMILVK